MSKEQVELGNSLLEVAEAFDNLQAMVVARKEGLERAGFSPTAAERMAMELWSAALRSGGQG